MELTRKESLLPREILEIICEYLQPPDLKHLALSSHSNLLVAIPFLYHSMRIKPLCTRLEWRNLIRRIERSVISGKQQKDGKGELPSSSSSTNTLNCVKKRTIIPSFNYSSFIKEIDDVWLFVGGEDGLEDDSDLADCCSPSQSVVPSNHFCGVASSTETMARSAFDHSTISLPSSSHAEEMEDPVALLSADFSSKLDIIENESQLKKKKDSGIDITSSIRPERFSAMYLIQLLIETNSLQALKLNFSSPHMVNLDWKRAMSNLVKLELCIRITDLEVNCLFNVNSPTLRSLTIKRAEISDTSLERFGLYLPDLKEIEIGVVPLRKRSKYQIMNDARIGNPITEVGMSELLKGCSRLWKLKISLSDFSITPKVYLLHQNLNLLKILQLTLSSPPNISTEQDNLPEGMTMEGIKNLLPSLPSLTCLFLNGSNVEGASMQDNIIDEDFLLSIPLLNPKLKHLFLSNLDICRNERGCMVFFGMKNCPWELDNLRRRFTLAWPSIELSCISN